MAVLGAPAGGRASVLFSIWMMVGAPEPIRAGSPCDGTSMTVVKLSFQSAASGSCLRFTAVCGMDRSYGWLCPSFKSRVAVLPSVDQLTCLLSNGFLLIVIGVFPVS